MEDGLWDFSACSVVVLPWSNGPGEVEGATEGLCEALFLPPKKLFLGLVKLSGFSGVPPDGSEEGVAGESEVINDPLLLRLTESFLEPSKPSFAADCDVGIGIDALLKWLGD